MIREKKERNKLIIERIERGDYQVDIAHDFNISEAMVSKIKKRHYLRIKKKGGKNV